MIMLDHKLCVLICKTLQIANKPIESGISNQIQKHHVSGFYYFLFLMNY